MRTAPSCTPLGGGQVAVHLLGHDDHPTQGKGQFGRRAEDKGRLDLEGFDVDVRAEEAVEAHQSVHARAGKMWAIPHY